VATVRVLQPAYQLEPRLLPRRRTGIASLASARATSPTKIGNGGTSLSHSIRIGLRFPLAGVRCRIDLTSETIPVVICAASSANLDDWVMGVSRKAAASMRALNTDCRIGENIDWLSSR
jgi:hypothetical protein